MKANWSPYSDTYYIVLIIIALFLSPSATAVILPSQAFPQFDKVISICSEDPSLTNVLVKAVHEWSSAICLFALKYAWFNPFGLELKVNEKPCDAYIMRRKLVSLPAITIQNQSLLIVYISDNIRNDDETFIILRHEIAQILGLGDTRIKGTTHYAQASVPTFQAKVTTYDVYAFHLKLAGASGNVGIPKYIPY